MAFNQAFANPEAKAGSAELLGGEERVEDSVAGLFAHAYAGIGNGEDNSFCACSRMSGGTGSQQESAACGAHRVQCIADEICEHLTDLSIEAGDGESGSPASFNDDRGTEEASLIHGQNRVEQFVAVN